MARNRLRRAKHQPAAPRDRVGTQKTRMARVAVADDVWADFRAAIGHRPISEVLGDLVAQEVERYRSRRLKDGQLEPRELVDALARARRQQEELAVLVERLERLRG